MMFFPNFPSRKPIKESLEKITDLYHFGMIDREVFFLCGNKKHDIERITRTIQEASVIIERIFHMKISWQDQFQRYQFKGTSCPLSAGSRSTWL